MQLAMTKRYLTLGLDEKLLKEFCQEDITRLDEEPGEEILLITTIKNQTVEKKGQRDYDEQVDEFDQKGMF